MVRLAGFEPAIGQKNRNFAPDPNTFGCGYLWAYSAKADPEVGQEEEPVNFAAYLGS